MWLFLCHFFIGLCERRKHSEESRIYHDKSEVRTCHNVLKCMVLRFFGNNFFGEPYTKQLPLRCVTGTGYLIKEGGVGGKKEFILCVLWAKI